MPPASDADRAIAALLYLWAALDVLQIPLIAAVFLSFRLARPLGRGWKAVAICFGGYTGWVVLTARFVPFAPSGWIVLLAGMILDPRRDASPLRIWALGSAVAAFAFWLVPTAIAWKLRRVRRAGTIADENRG